MKPIFIFCLGNPGYDATPHNLGFLFADCLGEVFSVKFEKGGLKKQVWTKAVNGAEQAFFVSKPTTFLNLSGEAVREMLLKTKIDPSIFIERMVVVYDDADIPMGEIRLKKTHGCNGHNGLRNISQVLNQLTKCPQVKISKIALGCDNSKRRAVQLSDYVLKKMSEEDFTQWRARLVEWIKHGLLEGKIMSGEGIVFV